MITEDQRAEINKAAEKAYIDEKKKIAKRQAREKAQWDSKTLLEKLFGLFSDD